MSPIPAIILAAGSASRMGATKQLLRINNQSLIQRTTQAVIDAGCHPIIIVTGSNAAAVTAEIAILPVQIQFNPNWSAGIGASIRVGLSAALQTNPSIPAILLTLCDQPHLNPTILRDLMDAHTTAKKPMTACEYSNTIGPPCCFTASVFDQLSQLEDGAGAKRLLLENPKNVKTILWPQGAIDLDTPQDVKNFRKSEPKS